MSVNLEDCYLSRKDLGVLAVHCGGEPTLMHRGWPTGLGPHGKGMKWLCRLAAQRHDAYGRQKNIFAFFLKRHVFFILSAITAVGHLGAIVGL